MLGGVRYGEVWVDGFVIEIEKILDVECHDAEVAGRFGFFGGREVNE